MTTDDRYVVKRDNGAGSTSVVMAPDTEEVAAAYMADLNAEYQDSGNYYIEKWEPRDDHR